VRSGTRILAGFLDWHYGEAYQLGIQAAESEPLVFRPSGPLPRSVVLCDWVTASLAAAGCREPRSVLEVGCGDGALLARLRAAWAGVEAEGVDLDPSAVRAARARGLSVRQGSHANVDRDYDVIVSTAVIEHVPDPIGFLRTLAERLTPGGALVVGLPTQDDGRSWDIFLFDHLHHFFRHHIRMLARRSGLAELHCSSSDDLPGFSLHVLSADPDSSLDRSATDDRAFGDVRPVVDAWLGRFAGIDRWLAERVNGRLGVFGAGQTLALFSAYTGLRTRRIDVGFDDNPTRAGSAVGGFPVARLEEAGPLLSPDLYVLVTFAPDAALEQRLASAGVDYYAPLAEPPSRS
jgi:SAM-dependent methyltransferase